MSMSTLDEKLEIKLVGDICGRFLVPWANCYRKETLLCLSVDEVVQEVGNFIFLSTDAVFHGFKLNLNEIW